MGVYDRQVASALKKIQAKGQLVTWRTTAPVLCADKPWIKQDGAPTDTPVYIAFVSGGGSLYTRLMAGSNIATGGQHGLMGSVSFTPSVSDVIIRGGLTMGIKSINPVNINGQVILYKLEFKS